MFSMLKRMEDEVKSLFCNREKLQRAEKRLQDVEESPAV